MTTLHTNVALRCQARAVVALLCFLAMAVSSAAEPIRSAKKPPHAQRLSPAAELAEKLTKLRNVTIKNFLPLQAFSDASFKWDTEPTDFDAAHQLFLPVARETHSDSLKRAVNQQSGLRVGPNTQFQFDVQRFWTVDDRQEVSVKLGLHFDFR